MAGYFMALHRLLRLKDPLRATVNGIEFKRLNRTEKFVKKVVDAINDDEFWQAIYFILRAVYPALRVLRLADRSKPGTDRLFFVYCACNCCRPFVFSHPRSKTGMDRLFYFTSQTTTSIEKSTEHLSLLPFIERTVDDEEEDDKKQDDDDDSDASSSDYDTDDLYGDVTVANKPDFGQDIKKLWVKRKKHLEHDYAILAWICSPLGEVHKHCADNFKFEHREAADRVLDKLFSGLAPLELNRTKNTFWQASPFCVV